MAQALKLNTGQYDQMLLDDCYSRLNRIIARITSRMESPAWSRAPRFAMIPTDGRKWSRTFPANPRMRIPMQREYLKPAGRVLN